MTIPVLKNWEAVWEAVGNDGYDPARNSAGCYADAIAAIRLRLVISGEAMPHENEKIDLQILRCINAPIPGSSN